MRREELVNVMKIFRRILIGMLLAATSTAAHAEILSLDAISAYLNRLNTAYTTFDQQNADGSTSSGQLFMARPGRIRFEYFKPDESIVIAGKGEVVLFDARSNDRPQQFQLANTPLKLILETDINLLNERMVVGHDFDGKHTVITAQDPRFPEYGALRLYFDERPQLTRWVLIDGGGGQTTVFLNELEIGASMPSRLFDIDRELEKRGF